MPVEYSAYFRLFIETRHMTSRQGGCENAHSKLWGVFANSWNTKKRSQNGSPKLNLFVKSWIANLRSIPDNSTVVSHNVGAAESNSTVIYKVKSSVRNYLIKIHSSFNHRSIGCYTEHLRFGFFYRHNPLLHVLWTFLWLLLLA